MLVYWTKQGVEVWFSQRFDLLVAPHLLKEIFCNLSTNFSIVMHVWFASFHPQCTMLCSACYFWLIIRPPLASVNKNKNATRVQVFKRSNMCKQKSCSRNADQLLVGQGGG